MTLELQQAPTVAAIPCQKQLKQGPTDGFVGFENYEPYPFVNLSSLANYNNLGIYVK